jgi:hypothetical protein
MAPFQKEMTWPRTYHLVFSFSLKKGSLSMLSRCFRRRILPKVMKKKTLLQYVMYKTSAGEELQCSREM